MNAGNQEKTNAIQFFKTIIEQKVGIIQDLQHHLLVTRIAFVIVAICLVVTILAC